MCYVIEHFQPKLTFLRWGTRTKSLYLYKNFLKIFFFKNFFLTNLNIFHSFKLRKVNKETLVKTFFTTSFLELDKIILQKGHFLIKNNFSKTLLYRMLKNFLLLKPTKVKLPLTNRLYYSDSQKIKFSLKTKHYNPILFFFQQTLISLWSSPLNSFLQLENGIDVNHLKLLYRYYNQYFFKIYSS